MDIREFSDQFDVFYNNVTSNQAAGLNEYEKSVFLTNGEVQLVKEYFNARTDAAGGGFDGSQKRQYDFSCLLRTEKLFNVNTFADRITDGEKIDRRSLVYLFPKDYFLSVNEILSDSRWQYSVLPIDYSEYQQLMLKPYSLPVKRGAWRLITDKKNCNYCKDYVENTVNNKTVRTDVDYTFLSSWADQKRNLKVNIIFHYVEDDVINILGGVPGNNKGEKKARLPYITDDETICFKSTKMSGDDSTIRRMRLSRNNEDSDELLTYNVTAELYATKELDDEEVVEALQEGCMAVAGLRDIKTSSNTLAKVIRHTDGFINMSAPSNFNRFKTGKEFTTDVVQLPMVEIIGKFEGVPDYQMRYVRTLKPIILDNLKSYGENLTIMGEDGPCECELPEEMHQEILERAVTLAKIAWQGGTLTQAQQANNR